MNLEQLAERVPACVTAAWVDVRTGSILEQRTVRDPARVEQVFDAVVELVRSPERPRCTVLLARDHVYIARRPDGQDRHVIVVVCERSPNLGVAVALVNAAADAPEGRDRREVRA